MVAQAGIAQYLQNRDPQSVPLIGLKCTPGHVHFPLIVYLTVSMRFNYLVITSSLPKPHNAHTTLMSK